MDAQSYISTLTAELREMDFARVMVAQAGEVFTSSGPLIAGLLISATSCGVAVYGDELQRLPNGTLGAARQRRPRRCGCAQAWLRGQRRPAPDVRAPLDR